MIKTIILIMIRLLVVRRPKPRLIKYHHDDQAHDHHLHDDHDYDHHPHDDHADQIVDQAAQAGSPHLTIELNIIITIIIIVIILMMIRRPKPGCPHLIRTSSLQI